MRCPGAQASDAKRREWNIQADESIFGDNKRDLIALVIALKTRCPNHTIGDENQRARSLRSFGDTRRCDVMVELKMMVRTRDRCGKSSLVVLIPVRDLTD